MEEQFYLTWPLLLRLGLRRELRRRTILVCLAVALVISLAMSAATFHHYGPRATYYATPVQLPCILLIIGIQRAFPGLGADAMLVVVSASVIAASTLLFVFFDRPIRRVGWRSYFGRLRVT